MTGIDHYMWCVTVGTTQLPCSDVGLYTKKTMALSENATNGKFMLDIEYIKF